METKLIEKDKDITALTTFGIPAKAKYYAKYESVRQLQYLAKSKEYLENEVLHIGGGSNLLFVTDYSGLILHSAIKGIKRYDGRDGHTFAIAGAGEKWTDFVDWCIENNLAGAENLAGIPGEVGASAVQNVGAYGVEAKDIIYSVECFDRQTREVVTLMADECNFDYRDSIFKHEGKNRYFVLRVAYRLTPTNQASNLEYGPLRNLSERLGRTPTIREVADEVTAIRNTKLPDPAAIGSAGSFFKNPVVGRYFFEQEVIGRCTDVPHYDIDENTVKIPAGWLIEHAGLKGYKIGGAYVYPKQCLVIANDGTASGKDVVLLSQHIRKTVMKKFGVVLHPEVNFIDNDIDVTILGTGTSKGVPEIGCGCRTCSSTDPHDKRLRTSVLLKTHGMNIIIDVSPDFRQQALKFGVTDVDAVMLTHTHYDHVGGIDDLRPLSANKHIPIYLREDVNADLHRRLDYCFRPNPYPGVPTFDMHVIDDRPFFINGLKVTPIEVMHGEMPIFGYRIGDFAFITDAKTISFEEKEKLRGLKVLVVNALRHREHFSHFNIEEALRLIDELKPQTAYLTHFNHEVLHEDLAANLPPNVHPAYDGLHFVVKG